MTTLAYLVGAGSLSLGAEKAGANIVKVYETPGYGQNAATWDLNRPELKHEILELRDAPEVLRSWQGLDLIIGNPPCGGVSSMTCSRINSETNCGMRLWTRGVVEARPRSILMENGYQLGTARMWPLLFDMAKILAENGYNWWTSIHYSYQLNTPQIRRRMFLYATLEEIKHPELLDLSDIKHLKREDTPTRPYLEDLIGVVPSMDPVKTKSGKIVTQHNYGPNTEAIMAFTKTWIHDRKYVDSGYVAPRDLQRAEEKLAAGDDSVKAYIETWRKKVWKDCPRDFQGMMMFRPGTVRLDIPAPAIIGCFKYLHPVDDRWLTQRELARLMGYNDSWQFHVVSPHLIAQGVPVENTRWAVERLRKIIDK